MLELYLGGARSGKSRLAEQRACSLAADRVYIATATAADGEMAQRIAHHRQQRGADGWTTVEAPLGLAATLAEQVRPDRLVLVDCLTLWLSNCLCEPLSEVWPAERQALLAVLGQLSGPVVLVSNEVGCGVVPLGQLSRTFVDEAGRLHQCIAAMADRVVLVTAGLEQQLKGT